MLRDVSRQLWGALCSQAFQLGNWDSFLVIQFVTGQAVCCCLGKQLNWQLAQKGIQMITWRLQFQLDLVVLFLRLICWLALVEWCQGCSLHEGHLVRF